MTLKASLLIPLFNRPEKLQAILEYLQKQTYSADYFEVILIDDSGPENYSRQKEITDQAKTRFTFKYLTTGLSKEVNGVTVARNIGIRQATSPLIIFMDDDCFPHPNLIEEHVKIHDKIERLILIGYKTESIEVLDQSLPIEIQTHLGRRESEKDRQGIISARNFSTSNASVKRCHLEEIGLFNESFAQPNEYGYEDCEIGERLLANNMVFKFNPHAVVYLIPKQKEEIDHRQALQMRVKAHRRFKRIQRKLKIKRVIKRFIKIFPHG